MRLTHGSFPRKRKPLFSIVRSTTEVPAFAGMTRRLGRMDRSVSSYSPTRAICAGE